MEERYSGELHDLKWSWFALGLTIGMLVIWAAFTFGG